MMSKSFRSFLGFAVALSFVLSAFLFGCGGQEQKTEEKTDTTAPKTDETSSTAHTTQTVAFTNANGDIICPISGEIVATKDKASSYTSSLYVDYEGKRYYFCCESCKPTFEKDSEKYKNGPPPGAKPMHDG